MSRKANKYKSLSDKLGIEDSGGEEIIEEPTVEEPSFNGEVEIYDHGKTAEIVSAENQPSIAVNKSFARVFDDAGDNLLEVIKKQKELAELGGDVARSYADIAKTTDNPKAQEAFARLIEASSTALEKVVDTYEKMTNMQKNIRSSGPVGQPAGGPLGAGSSTMIQNAVFVGNPKDVKNLLKDYGLEPPNALKTERDPQDEELSTAKDLPISQDV